MATARRPEDRHGDRDNEEYRRKEPPRQQEPAPARRAPQLNEYFIDGEGILREVLQLEICKYLGAEATCRPGEYNGRKGYRVKALRPFTPEMIVDLKSASAEWSSENRNRGTRGYQGTPRSDGFESPRSNHHAEVPYGESDTRRRQDVPSSSSESSYQSPSSVHAIANSGYTASEAGMAYPPSSIYPTGSGYPSTTYSAAPGLNVTSNYAAMAAEPSRPGGFGPEYIHGPPSHVYGHNSGYQTYPPPGGFREQPGPREQQLPPGYMYPPNQRAPAMPPSGRGGPMDPNRGEYDYPMGMSAQNSSTYGADPYRGQPPQYGGNTGTNRPHDPRSSGPPPDTYYRRQ